MDMLKDKYSLQIRRTKLYRMNIQELADCAPMFSVLMVYGLAVLFTYDALKNYFDKISEKKEIERAKSKSKHY